MKFGLENFKMLASIKFCFLEIHSSLAFLKNSQIRPGQKKFQKQYLYQMVPNTAHSSIDDLKHKYRIPNVLSYL